MAGGGGGFSIGWRAMPDLGGLNLTGEGMQDAKTAGRSPHATVIPLADNVAGYGVDSLVVADTLYRCRTGYGPRAVTLAASKM